MLVNIAENGHPILRGTSSFETGTLKGKGGGKSSIYFCGDDETIEVLFRTIISASQLRICGAVADMCEESILLFSEVSAIAGKLVAKDPEAVVPLSDVLNEINSRPTNDPARGDTLRKYKQQIEDLPEDLRINKMCSEAGFIQTVVPGQYFVTIGETELANLDVPIACREYTLPRNEESTKAKWWIRENTKIGLVLEVTVSYHQGCHGIEIRMNSLSGDGSHSCVIVSILV